MNYPTYNNDDVSRSGGFDSLSYSVPPMNEYYVNTEPQGYDLWFSQARDMLETCHDRFNLVATKIDPILKENQPSSVGTDAKGTSPSTSCKLENDLLRLYLLASNLVSRINEVDSRIAL